jgi:hypothetical protein
MNRQVHTRSGLIARERFNFFNATHGRDDACKH